MPPPPSPLPLIPTPLTPTPLPPPTPSYPPYPILPPLPPPTPPPPPPLPQASFIEPYLGAEGGYVQVTRATGTGPVLLLLPLPGNNFEAWRPLRHGEDKMRLDFMYEMTYELMLLSAGYAGHSSPPPPPSLFPPPSPPPLRPPLSPAPHQPPPYLPRSSVVSLGRV